MKFLLSAALVFAFGCSSQSQTTPTDSPTGGGRVSLDTCGYDVETPEEMSAPEVGSEYLGTDPTPKHVHLGFKGDPKTSMVVSWRTVDDTTRRSTVQFGKGDDLGTTLEGLTYIYPDGAKDIRLHEAHLCGLEAGTEYSYRVGGDGHWSPTYKFRTAPASAASTVQIAVLGDSRGGLEVFRQMAEHIAPEEPDLILFTGDAVTWGNQQPEWEDFFAAGEQLFARAPVLATNGNHEGNAMQFYGQFVMPGDEQNFAVSYGAAHVSMVNDSPDGGETALRATVAPALDKSLASASESQWKLVVHHRSLYSAAKRHGSNADLRAILEPIIDAHKADLVLSGHDHNYERTHPMRGGHVAPPPEDAGGLPDGTVYVVSGGAGADLYDNGKETWTVQSAKSHSFLLLVAGPLGLTADAQREDGSMLDSFSLSP